MSIIALLTLLAGKPILTTTIFIAGTALITWFVTTYWYILLGVLLLWAIPKVLEILRGVGIDFSRAEPLIQWIDGKQKVAEDYLMDALDMLKKGVRRMGSTFVKKDANTVIKKHELIVDLGNDQGALIKGEENIRWDDVPENIRAELIKHKLDSFSVNDYDVIDQKVKQRAEEENMPELMKMVC